MTTRKTTTLKAIAGIAVATATIGMVGVRLTNFHAGAEDVTVRQDGYYAACGGVNQDDLRATREWLQAEKYKEENYTSKGVYNIGVKAYEYETPEGEKAYCFEVWADEPETEEEEILEDDESCQSEEVEPQVEDDVSSGSGIYSVNDSEFCLLCKLAYAEETRAGYAQIEHDREVANIIFVVLNRVTSIEFPNSIEGVIFDTKNGQQFSPANARTREIEWFPEAGKLATMTWSDVPEETKLQVQAAIDGQFRNRGYLFYYASKEDVPGKDRICGTVFY